MLSHFNCRPVPLWLRLLWFELLEFIKYFLLFSKQLRPKLSSLSRKLEPRVDRRDRETISRIYARCSQRVYVFLVKAFEGQVKTLLTKQLQGVPEKIEH